MIEKLARWYLTMKMKKSRGLEMVIRNDSWTYYRRDRDKEESIKKTLYKTK